MADHSRRAQSGPLGTTAEPIGRER
jgi:hypothetical protein